jgi:hypothetical protein
MTDARVTQTSVEEWTAGNPVAQITQTAAEVWGAITGTSRNAVVSQVAVEQWASVPLPIVLGGQTAVAVNTG